jgi:hypothetical protein
MVEQICPECQHGNPLDNRFCGQCGTSLTGHSLVPRQETGLTVAGYHLPAGQLKQVGQTVAVSLLAIAAEAGVAWLRRRVGLVDVAPGVAKLAGQLPAVKGKMALVAAPSPSARRVVSVFSQRVVAVWSEDGFVRQTVERVTWRREP